MRETGQDVIAFCILAGAFLLIIGVSLGFGYSFYWVSTTYSIGTAIVSMLGVGTILICVALIAVKVDRRL